MQGAMQVYRKAKQLEEDSPVDRQAGSTMQMRIHQTLGLYIWRIGAKRIYFLRFPCEFLIERLPESLSLVSLVAEVRIAKQAALNILLGPFQHLSDRLQLD